VVASSKSRCPVLVMLRSAEANPHVTNRAGEPTGEPTCSAPVAHRAATRRSWTVRRVSDPPG
jgi:hypothetical protein